MKRTWPLEQIKQGVVRGRVISIPAIAEDNDLLGRKPGEYLWDDPEGLDYGEFLRARQRESIPMMWSALYQQRPAPEEGEYFKAVWLRPCTTVPARETLAVYGASDYAVTANGGDYTVHVVVGVDPDGRMYLLDLWWALSPRVGKVGGRRTPGAREQNASTHSSDDACLRGKSCRGAARSARGRPPGHRGAGAIDPGANGPARTLRAAERLLGFRVAIGAPVIPAGKQCRTSRS